MRPFKNPANLMTPFRFILPLACGFVFSGFAAPVATNAEETDDFPRAAHPKPFSRPPSMGGNYDTWRDATGPDIGEIMVDAGRLPSRVDNSERPQFPPIYRQRWGACGQFTAIASMFTYEMNVLNGTHADTDGRRFPAHFSWNMMNNAKNQGSEAYHGWEVAKHIGIPTAKSYGGIRLDKIGPWPNGYAVWREAMEYRVSGYRYSPAVTVAQINEARGWLYDRNQPGQGEEGIGGLLALDGRMGEREKVTKIIAEGEHQAGKELWIRWGPSGYGHGITCVGYDDEVGFDLNGDGKITNDIDINGDGKVTLADWERGAFIVANSWGENWANEGRIYLLYSAMVDATWERGNYLGRVEVSRYQPRHTLRLKLACADRSALRVTLGIAGDKDAAKPEYEYAPQVLNGWPLFGKRNITGQVPLAGPDDNTPLEIGIDLRSLLAGLNDDADGIGRFFLRIDSAESSEANSKLYECAIRTYDAEGAFVSEAEVAIRDGNFGESPVVIEALIHDLPRG